ncbi:MAG: DUF2905 domain-containing protein [Gemmatimonadota bacterium]|nr:DUF2905 domain-containing protein [Gemmatimonadota bacterium]
MTEPQWPNLGPWLVGAGLVLVVVGALVWSGGLAWLGRLPGDLHFEQGRTRVYVPFTSMLVVSVVLSVVLSLVRRLF